MEKVTPLGGQLVNNWMGDLSRVRQELLLAAKRKQVENMDSVEYELIGSLTNFLAMSYDRLSLLRDNYESEGHL